ncbi:MAG: hypothetical protein DELT_02308 [Desulfovibrio sp.]
MHEREKKSAGNIARRPRNAEKSRGRILEAAVRFFQERAYDKVHMREIAAAANVDVALINRYFTSKKQLFAAACAEARKQHTLFSGGTFEECVSEPYVDMITGKSLDAKAHALVAMIISGDNPDIAPIVRESFREAALVMADMLGDRDNLTPAYVLMAYGIGSVLLMDSFDDADKVGIDRKMFIAMHEKIIGWLRDNAASK